MPSPTNRVLEIINNLQKQGVTVRKNGGGHYICRFPNGNSVTISTSPGKGVDQAIKRINADIRRAWID